MYTAVNVKGEVNRNGTVVINSERRIGYIYSSDDKYATITTTRDVYIEDLITGKQ